MKKYLYHVTTKENAMKILKNGLKPVQGHNRNMIWDDRDGVFLCKKKDVGKWKILLYADTVLCVDVTDIICDMKTEDYVDGLYGEYIYTKEIPSDKISISTVKETEKDMIDLCISYMGTLSSITTQCALYYNGYPDDKDWIKQQLTIAYKTMTNLDFSCIKGEELRDAIRELRDNDYFTLVDYYKDTRKRLWQQLRLYPHDELTEIRVKIYNYIYKYIWHKISHVNTGKWMD